MSSKQPFQKFIQQKESGAKKRERIRQEKKKVRQETKEYFERKKLEARGQGTRYKEQDIGNKTQDTRYKGQDPRDREQGAKHKRQDTRGRQQETKFRDKNSTGKNAAKKDLQPVKADHSSKKIITGNNLKKVSQGVKNSPSAGKGRGEAVMPLNKFIAHSGVCARRDAAEMVKAGKVTVNGQQVTEPGFKVNGTEEVKVNGKKISIRKNLVYILLNKPKDFITTTDDPQGRKTVLDIIKKATTERVYPVGRLDRNTTGVLLLTNDGELAQKLSHPSYEVKKIYEVKLDKPLVKKDFDTILKGITLEDGIIAPDVLAYSDTKDKSVIGIEIHSGRNRIVRRIFEALGYDVRNLDRVMYGNLTKKNVDRGKWRFLTEKEVRLLKYLNASYTRK